MVRNGIPTVCFYMCSTERKSELFSLLLRGSEGNCESMILFLFPRKKEFRVVFSSAKVLGREFREFASIFAQGNRIPSCFLFRGRVRNGIPRVFVPRNSRNSVGINHWFRLFRLPRNYFFVGNSQPYAWRVKNNWINWFGNTQQIKGLWESNINVWFRFMNSQKWNCMASLFPGQNYNVLSPNFQFTLMYLWAIYIFLGLICLFCCSQIGRPILGIYSIIAHRYMNAGIGNEATQFHFWECLKSDFRYKLSIVKFVPK